MKGKGNSKDNFNFFFFLRKCFKCNSEGHIAKDCKGKVTCYKCNKKGNISKNFDESKATISIKKELASVLEEKSAKALIYKKKGS